MKILVLITYISFCFASIYFWSEPSAISKNIQKIRHLYKHDTRSYYDQTISCIKGYCDNKSSDHVSTHQKFTGFGDSIVGVWKPKPEHPHGVEFMFRIAIDYFRCDGGRTGLVTRKEELDKLDYVVTPWNVVDLPSWGWELVADADYVNVYQNPRKR